MSIWGIRANFSFSHYPHLILIRSAKAHQRQSSFSLNPAPASQPTSEFIFNTHFEDFLWIFAESIQLMLSLEEIWRFSLNTFCYSQLIDFLCCNYSNWFCRKSLEFFHRLNTFSGCFKNNSAAEKAPFQTVSACRLQIYLLRACELIDQTKGKREFLTTYSERFNIGTAREKLNQKL